MYSPILQCKCTLSIRNVYFSNIDVRIQQAELEYRLGREELELLTLHEESRALQTALELAETQEKQKNDTIFRYILNFILLPTFPSIQLVKTITSFACFYLSSNKN